ncbi:MAG: acyl-CoA N-acyltransferase, partial [Desulfomonilaceae bacterium]
AIVDTRFNRYQKTGAGIWGFFECENDPKAAQALFSAAGEWAASQGMTYLLGPFCPSTNYEIGMLIEGFEHLATFMMPFNPPYYVELAESCNLVKEKDLLSFIVDRSWEYPQWMLHIAEKLNTDSRFSVRTPSRASDRVEEVVALIRKIYDECWADNWGFVPATDGEVQELAKELERFADEDLIFFIYFNEEPIGAALMVPDVNPLLKRFNGKIGILGPLKYLLFKKEIRGVRGLLLGIKRQYQDMGVPFFLLYHALDRTKNKQQYQYLELGWNLEDNHDINQLEMDGGAKLFKKYRIYRKNLTDRW